VDERELKLNSLARYSKSSPLYVLEEHGHCEVPAGCGGVVLRWRNPRAGVPLYMWLYRDGDSWVADGGVFIDGAPPLSARPLVSFGEHALAFKLTVADPRYTVLMFAAFYPPPAGAHVGVRSSAEQDVAVSVLSAADATWRYTADEPAGDAWMHAGFDDSGWPTMTARPDRRPPQDPNRDIGRYSFERLQRLGAAGLGVRAHAGRIWVRRAFEVTERSAELRAIRSDDA
jgi:hypothetical protein